MADDKVALEIFIEADKANLSLGELEKGFDSMKERLKDVGRGSEEFKTLSTAMAGTSAEIKNIELGFEGLDREQIASEFGGLAGGIGDVTASLVLMGGENETIEQMGASIEKAMGISMGIKGVMEGAAAANKLYTNSVRAKAIVEKVAAAGTWILNAANKALNTTLKMNPIGLIVIAITAVVGAIIYFKDSIMGLIKTALEPFQFIIDLVIDGLQAMGIMATDEAIAQEEAAKKVIDAAKKRNEAADELRRVHKEVTESMISDLDFEIRKRTIAGKDFAELSRKKIELLQEVAIEEAKATEVNRAALEKTMETMGFLGKAYEDVYTKAVKTSKDAAAEVKKLSEDLVVHDLEQEKKKSEARDAGAEARAMNRAKEQQAKKDALMEDIERVEVDKTMQTEELDRHSIHIEGLKSNEQILHDAKNFWHNKDLERIAEENAARREAAQIAMDLALTTLSAISDVSNAYADRDLKAEEDRFNNLRATKQLTEKQLAAEELKSAKIKDKIRKKQFENDKKMQIAMAAINGAQALTSILAQYPKFDGGFAMVAALAGSVITTAASIAKIKATTFSSTPMPALPTLDSGDGGAGGASAAAAGAAITPVSNTSTILGNQQVFVTETDITDTQNNVSVIEDSATF
tara:strand:+ start:215 stop:2122 length:1908 start_codon:yes stop_codon:yes gene_type:complete